MFTATKIKTQLCRIERALPFSLLLFFSFYIGMSEISFAKDVDNDGKADLFGDRQHKFFIVNPHRR